MYVFYIEYRPVSLGSGLGICSLQYKLVTICAGKAILQHSVIGRYWLVHTLSHMMETKFFSIEHLMVLFISSREVLVRDKMWGYRPKGHQLDVMKVKVQN